MKDAYGVFGVTDFREYGYEESRQGKTLVDAAKAAGVKHFVWSTFDHTETGIKVPHFESKWEVDGTHPQTLFNSIFGRTLETVWCAKDLIVYRNVL
jgi:uncharacterized protein YbjT (DUF2867 family)